jgi:hypothetical protein
VRSPLSSTPAFEELTCPWPLRPTSSPAQGTRITEEPYKPWCCGKFPSKCQRSPQHGVFGSTKVRPLPLSFRRKGRHCDRYLSLWNPTTGVVTGPFVSHFILFHHSMFVSRASTRKVAWMHPVHSATHFCEFRIRLKVSYP